MCCAQHRTKGLENARVIIKRVKGNYLRVGAALKVKKQKTYLKDLSEIAKRTQSPVLLPAAIIKE